MGLQYCSIEFFSSGIFSVRYSGIIEPCGMRFFILLPKGLTVSVKDIFHGIEANCGTVHLPSPL